MSLAKKDQVTLKACYRASLAFFSTSCPGKSTSQARSSLSEGIKQYKVSIDELELERKRIQKAIIPVEVGLLTPLILN